jgi:hypothetical protein
MRERTITARTAFPLRIRSRIPSGAFSTGVTSLKKKLLLLFIRNNPATMINKSDRSSDNRKFR